MSKKKNSRAAQGDGTIRQRTPDRWEARFTVGRDPGTGKQIQKSIYGKTQDEVRQKLKSATKDIDDGIYTEPSKLTIGKWLEIWLAEYVKDSVKPLTYKAYEVECRVHISSALGQVKMTELNPHLIQSFYNKIFRGTDTKKPLSAKSVRNIHGTLHRALKQAQKLGYIRYNPTEACTLPRITKKEIKPLEETEISSFLEKIKGHRFEAVFTVTLFTGMRQGEVLGLTWDCVDFRNSSILINKQIQKRKGGKIDIVTLKNDKTRRITAAQFVMHALWEQRQRQAEMKIKAGSLWNNEHNLVFTNEIGSNLLNHTVYKNYKKVVESLGLPEARFHDLRHSYAVAALSSGDCVKTVSENLGHHSAAFTLDVYGHVSEKMKRDSANLMDEYINNVRKLG